MRKRGVRRCDAGSEAASMRRG